MPSVFFKRPTTLSSGRVCQKGAHDVDDSDISGWFMASLLKNGDVVIAVADKPAKKKAIKVVVEAVEAVEAEKE